MKYGARGTGSGRGSLSALAFAFLRHERRDGFHCAPSAPRGGIVPEFSCGLPHELIAGPPSIST